MLTRIIASLALVPLFLFVVYGGIPLYIAETAIVYIALHEFYKAFKIKDVHPIFIIGYLFSIYLAVKNIFNLPRCLAISSCLICFNNSSGSGLCSSITLPPLLLFLL